MKPYIVIGVYKPKKSRKCFEIGRYLTRFTRELGLIPFSNDDIKRNSKAAWFDYNLHAEVRRTARIGSEGTEWHQDGDSSTTNMNCGMVLWSDRDSTEFIYSLKDINSEFKVDNKIYQCNPFEIVYINNLDCYHRRPPEVEGKRLSFRQRVEVWKNISVPIGSER